MQKDRDAIIRELEERRKKSRFIRQQADNTKSQDDIANNQNTYDFKVQRGDSNLSSEKSNRVININDSAPPLKSNKIFMLSEENLINRTCVDKRPNSAFCEVESNMTDILRFKNEVPEDSPIHPNPPHEIEEHKDSTIEVVEIDDTQKAKLYESITGASKSSQKTQNKLNDSQIIE